MKSTQYHNNYSISRAFMQAIAPQYHKNYLTSRAFIAGNRCKLGTP
jgi:hypothetical protein